MASWRRRCSSRPARTETRSAIRALILASLLGLACATTPARAAAPTPEVASEVLCVPSGQGYLRARLRGAIEADLAWTAPQPQCRGALRPGGNGVRLLFKGLAGSRGEKLTIVLGAGPLRPGERARQVPVNFTLVRDGTGQFYATRGDDKCSFDDVQQVPVDAARGLYRLDARGFCTQPARALSGEGSLLLSRFDLQVLVDFSPPAETPPPESAPKRRPRRDPDETST